MSAPFRYKTVHRVRKLQEQEKKRILGSLIGELEREKNHGAQLDSMQMQINEVLAKSGTGKKMTAAAARVFSARAQWLEHEKQKSIQRVKELNRKVETARKQAADAYKLRRVFDILQEQHNEKVRLETLRIEGRQIDDVAVMRYESGQKIAMEKRSRS